MPERKYVYYDYTISLCTTCHRRVSAKIVFYKESVYMFKRCPEHGEEHVLISDDIAYYKSCRNYNKASEVPLKFSTETHMGCPYDCGLCPDHEQHSCLSLVEITDRCNLSCPVCYAVSSPMNGHHRSVKEVERMFDLIVEHEGQPDVVQISGGEPTVHPQLFEILDIAKTKPIRHLMMNTNGIRIAKDREFVKQLAGYMPGFELYLQFDSLKREPYLDLRGEDILDLKLKALDHLNEFNLSTTLVMTVANGLNSDEIGAMIEFALKQKCVRGVTFQPVQYAGRTEGMTKHRRLNLAGVRNEIMKQTSIFNSDDLIPVPCNPDALAMAYALKVEDEVIPLTRFINPADILDNSRNTIVYEQDEKLKSHMIRLFSTGVSQDCMEDEMNALLCCLPKVQNSSLSYSNLFRVIIMQFIDASNFDVRAIKKSCVHIVHNDKLIPFETMNLLYRNKSEAEVKELGKLPLV